MPRKAKATPTQNLQDQLNAAAGTAPAHTSAGLPKGKLGVLVTMLRRPGGAAISDMMEATGWQAHSVRGALAGALKTKRKFVIESEKTEQGRLYRIAGEGV